MSRFSLLVLDAPCTERYARCGERTGVNHPLLLDYFPPLVKGAFHAEKDSRKAQRRVNLVASLLALALSIGIALNRGLSTALELYANCRILSDAFFISGIFFGGIGALVAISTTGFFDMFAYAFKSLPMLFSFLRKPKDHPTFFDYKTAKAEKREQVQYGLLIIGLVCIAVSLLALAGYYNL